MKKQKKLIALSLAITVSCTAMTFPAEAREFPFTDGTTYDWSDDFTVCTASRLDAGSGLPITETVSVDPEIVNPTCTEDGYISGNAIFDNFEDVFVRQTLPKLGHTHTDITYEWAEDNSHCYATYLCTNCNTTFTASELVMTVTETPANCETDGALHYEAIFAPCIGIDGQETTVASEAKHGHTYIYPTYSWNEDKTECTATCICSECGDMLIETVAAEKNVCPATCTENGYISSKALFTNTEFENVYTFTLLPATGHTHSDIKYKWADDNSSCTASFYCPDCDNIFESKNLAIKTTETPATCTSFGSITYTAMFVPCDGFAVQEKTVTTEKAEHSFGASAYSWHKNMQGCTATHICETCGIAEAEVTVPKIRTKNGKTVFEAKFTDKAFETQEKEAPFPPLRTLVCTTRNVEPKPVSVATETQGKTSGFAIDIKPFSMEKFL